MAPPYRQPQSTTSSASIVVGSSSVEAVKFGGAAPKRVRQTRYDDRRADGRIRQTQCAGGQLHSDRDRRRCRQKSKGAIDRPSKDARLSVQGARLPWAVTSPEAVVGSSRTPAGARVQSRTRSTRGWWTMPKASIEEPTDICCGLLISAVLCPKTVTSVLGPRMTNVGAAKEGFGAIVCNQSPVFDGEGVAAARRHDARHPIQASALHTAARQHLGGGKCHLHRVGGAAVA